MYCLKLLEKDITESHLMCTRHWPKHEHDHPFCIVKCRGTNRFWATQKEIMCFLCPRQHSKGNSLFDANWINKWFHLPHGITRSGRNGILTKWINNQFLSASQCALDFNFRFQFADTWSDAHQTCCILHANMVFFARARTRFKFFFPNKFPSHTFCIYNCVPLVAASSINSGDSFNPRYLNVRMCATTIAWRTNLLTTQEERPVLISHIKCLIKCKWND